MKLTYHTGRNFGDALNPWVFDGLFPGLIDEDDSVLLIGIGSLFGLKNRTEENQQRIYFSTGYAAGDIGTYGRPPELTDKDHVYCVRGPLTANILGLDPQLAIADGAILAPLFMDIPVRKERIKWSYIPHVGSFSFHHGLADIMAAEGITLIDPRDDVHEVLGRIAASDVVIAEAMHGAIMADALGVPWIAVTMFPTINEFKWKDFAASMDLSYRPERIPALFDDDAVASIMRNRFSRSRSSPQASLAAWFYRQYRSRVISDQVYRKLRQLKELPAALSERSILEQRRQQLLERADQLGRKWKITT